MSQLSYGSGRIEAPDPESRRASSIDPNLAAAVLDAGDVRQWDRERRRPVAGEEGVWARDLEFAHVFWAVTFVPPDRIGVSTHVPRLRFFASGCIRTGHRERAENPQIV